MASDASRHPSPWRNHHSRSRSSQGTFRQWSHPVEQNEPKIHFQCATPKHSREPPQRFSIPLRLAMDASPMIDRNFDSAIDIRNVENLKKEAIVKLGNDFKPDSIKLFLQYICRRQPSLAANFPISDEDLPKLWLWTQTYLLAKEFEVKGLQRLLTRRIRRRLVELEEVGEMCEEWWGVIELVKDENSEWEWLRDIMVDVKALVAMEDRAAGICMLDGLPEDESEWYVVPEKGGEYEEEEEIEDGGG